MDRVQVYGLDDFRRLGFESCTLLYTFFSLLFFQKFSKYFCRINSVGKGRPAAGSIATAYCLLLLPFVSEVPLILDLWSR